LRAKFCPWAFALKANKQQSPNAYMAVLFGSFDAKNLFGEGKFVHNINGNPNSLERTNFFFPNLYFQTYILMDFYLGYLRRNVQDPLDQTAVV
jgi:hypothetical protein